MSGRVLGGLALGAFVATIPAANWLIGHVGVQFDPAGPHLIPVGLGLMAPSGVLMVGAALLLRDLVQQRLGIWWALAAVVLGGILSGLIAPSSLAAASVGAFLFSELADTAVYTPLRRRGLLWAVALSGLVGALVDSAVFLALAFGSLDYLAGHALGKLWVTLAALPLLWALRSRRDMTEAA